MELGSHLHGLFVYDAWANREFLAALQVIRTPPPRSARLLAHIVAAEWLWLNRLQGETQRLAVWPEFTVDQSREEFAPLPDLWSRFLGSAAERLDAPARYVNSKGEPWTSTVHDIVTHVVLHSAYHRGQIATDMRAAGFDPPYTDYIHATRKGLL